MSEGVAVKRCEQCGGPIPPDDTGLPLSNTCSRECQIAFNLALRDEIVSFDEIGDADVAALFKRSGLTLDLKAKAIA